MGKRTAITDARARAFTAPPGREAVLWDGVVTGLGLRARASGRKTWFVHRRIGNEVVKRTLAAADTMPVEDATGDGDGGLGNHDLRRSHVIWRFGAGRPCGRGSRPPWIDVRRSILA